MTFESLAGDEQRLTGDTGSWRSTCWFHKHDLTKTHICPVHGREEIEGLLDARVSGAT